MSRSFTVPAAIIAAAVCVAVGSTIAWSKLAAPVNAPAYVTKADFDQAFADAAAGHREFNPIDREKLRNAGWRIVEADFATQIGAR
jgi:hypothetical protein